MMRFWIWWYKRREGDASQTVALRPRVRELLHLLFFGIYRLIEPRFVLFVSFGAFSAAIIAIWNIPVFHRIWSEGFWDVTNGEGVRDLVLAATTLVGGLIGLAGYLLLAVRTSAIQRQTELQREEQITDRFTKAVEQLGSEKRAVRLGAIYALERIAKDSERDFTTIMETLAAFVREQAPWPSAEMLSGDAENFEEADQSADNTRVVPAIDVSAAVAVLSRAIPANHPLRTGSDTAGRVDLRRVDLRRLDMPNALLKGFRFDNSNLAGAHLPRANLVDASLSRVVLSDAYCACSDLRGASLFNLSADSCDFRQTNLASAVAPLADFSNATLTGADFQRARLSGASFSGALMLKAKFCSAYLSGVDFSDAYLSQVDFCDAQITSADFSRVQGLVQDSLVTAIAEEDHGPKNLPDGIFPPRIDEE